MKYQTKTRIVLSNLLAWLTLGAIPLAGHAQGTAFTYQGRLATGTNAAAGVYDLRFSIYDSPSGGVQQGVLLTNSATGVTNGLFIVTLDFGNQFPGTARWLEIGVRTNGGGAFTILSPRQALTPTPYAVFASSASNVSGTISSASLVGTYANAVTLNNPGNQFSGSYTGNGTGLTNVNAASLNGLSAAGFWQLGGNTVSAGQFMGSINSQPVELKAGNLRALRLEPNANGAPNVIGGAPLNYIAPGTVGATIGGGGATNYSTGTFFGSNPSNAISANFGFIGGGSANSILPTAFNSVIAGGFGNTVQSNAPDSFIGGGNENVIQSNLVSSLIGGGDQNIIMAGSSFSTIGGGGVNYIQNNAPSSVIGGGEYNQVGASANHGTIGGGEFNALYNFSDHSTISGGYANVVGGVQGTVAGGSNNLAMGSYAFIGGGGNNTVSGPFVYSVIGGGQFNNARGHMSFIGGGNHNVTSEQGAFIGAGDNNTASGFGSIIVGGSANSASGPASFIGGGEVNSASGWDSAVGGGAQNSASGTNSVVPGGYFNQASGSYSLAAGQRALALHQGAFVWADSQNTAFASTANNQFLIRANGNVRFNTNNPTSTLQVNGQIAATSLRSPGAGIGTGTFAFIHRAVTTNTIGNVTTIYNPLTDGDPNAIVIITHNWTSDTNSSSRYNTIPVGVFYNLTHWAIYNEDLSNMGLGRAFNVMVIKP